MDSILKNIDSDDSSDDLELDTSWIENEERLEQIQQNYFREPMEFIEVFFVYINTNDYIEKIISEKHPLSIMEDKKTSVLKKEYLLQLIQNKKIKTGHSIYKLMDILIYNINIEPDFIQNYSKNENIAENSAGFFQVLKIVDDILFTPSIFIFHDLNSMFILFQEKEFDITKAKPKSILKVSSNGDNKSTKKVKIMESNIDSSSNTHKKMTRKRFSRKYFNESDNQL